MRGAIVVQIVVLVAAAGLTRATPAFAHAGYERSTPGAGETVASSPPRLDLWFTQELFRRAGANTLGVFDATGNPVYVGEAEIDQADRKHLSVGLRPALEPGSYTVRWTSLSATDGDPAEGTFGFTIDPSARAAVATPTGAAAPAVIQTSPASPAPPTTPPSATGPATSTGMPLWPFLAAAAILLTGSLGAWAIVAAGKSQP